MPKRDGKWYCDYHPEIETHWVKRGKTRYITCAECEWNPPSANMGSSPSEVGRTSPDILTIGERLEMDDGFDPRPNGELQEQINWLESRNETDPSEYDYHDLWDGRVDWSRDED
jgi:hypothetical protein